ncbi:hypothetical protein F8M41_015541 [Gigaspora margarita]|uniref:F-box domain-containing protein n=1 Tax=Gigaspora margarita TaxID=4874 RepID=A0A8H4AQD5_GIGMA|nr:hypothetical protein F8M41_015541 [Gigaspora margarita]
MSLPILLIECIWRVIELQKDLKTLFSCLLLNRQCCKITAPILRSEPIFKNGNIFKILILGLNDYEISLIPNIDCFIPPDNDLLFDYLTFVTKISADLNEGVNEWLNVEKNFDLYQIMIAFIIMLLRKSEKIKKLEFKGYRLDLWNIFFQLT